MARLEPLEDDSNPADARTRVVLADSTALEIPIRDAQVLFALPATLGAHWLLVRGVDCSRCDAPELVWLFRTPPTPITTLSESFMFPGLLTNADETEPYFRSRLFVGSCLRDANPVAVWLEETLHPESERTREVRVLRGLPRLHDSTFAWTGELERDIESRTRSGVCREISPRDQMIM